METIDSIADPRYARRKIKLSDQDPLTLAVHGDRLLLEMLEVDEETESGLLLVREDDIKKEHVIGWSAGVIVNFGNGHRLDTPDQAVAVQTTEKKPTSENLLRFVDDETGSGIAMVPSTVPMPFARGMVVMVAKHAGSDILLQGREYKIVTQTHVLTTFAKLRLNVGAPQPQEAPEGFVPATVRRMTNVTPQAALAAASGEATAEMYADEK